MSLLNDALRAAEQRQQRPDAPSAYTGGAVQGGQGGNRWLLVCLLLLVMLIAAAGAYWLLVQEGEVSRPETSAPVIADSGQGQVQRSEPAEDRSVVAPEADSGEQQPEPESVAEQTQPSPGQKRPVAVEPVQKAATKKSPTNTASSEPQIAEPVESESRPQLPNEETPESFEAPVVKTTPQSPDAIDRQTARDIETLLSNGRMVEAERRLASLTQNQKAPRSRFAVARALLVEGDAARALDWLPANAAASDARLRMLRARALHTDGQLQAAVSTLQSQVPPVADQPEYRVTLATLLQQQGDSEQAARHWAELIAWDDSRAPWWVGLAISLEDQGQNRSAARAYEQAAALPGLSPSLADYVQRRLRSLRAG